MTKYSIPFDHFEAVVVDCEVLCVEDCCPPEALPDAYPVFAGSEWDHYPVCGVCGKVHDYVVLTGETENLANVI